VSSLNPLSQPTNTQSLMFQRITTLQLYSRARKLALFPYEEDL
jgi:hypothetical protein